MGRRIVQELTGQQSLILRQAASRVMDAQAVVDHEDAIYKALLGMIYPGDGAGFDPTYGRGVFYVDEEDGEPEEGQCAIRLMDDDEEDIEVEVELEDAPDPLPDGDEG